MIRSIYVVRSEPGPVKVGIAGKPARRLSTLRTSSAVPLFLDFVAETDGDVRAVEKRAHAILEQKRLSGEWFGVESREAIAAVIQAARELGLDLSVLTPHEKRTTVFQVRMRPSVKAAGEKTAAAENRSLASLMEMLLIEHLRAKGMLR